MKLSRLHKLYRELALLINLTIKSSMIMSSYYLEILREKQSEGILVLSSTVYIHSSKKVTQHDFDRLYFYYLGFLFIKLDIPRKLVYLPFH